MSRLLIAFCALMAVSLPARSDTYTFVVKSLHPNLVHIKLFSSNRDAVWPSGGQVYVLDDDNAHAMTLNCRAGEKICFGAWVAGTGKTVEWGRGKSGKAGCDRCCHACQNGTKSGVITLNIRRQGNSVTPVYAEDLRQPSRPPKAVLFDDP